MSTAALDFLSKRLEKIESLLRAEHDNLKNDFKAFEPRQLSEHSGLLDEEIDEVQEPAVEMLQKDSEAQQTRSSLTWMSVESNRNSLMSVGATDSVTEFKNKSDIKTLQLPETGSTISKRSSTSSRNSSSSQNPLQVVDHKGSLASQSSSSSASKPPLPEATRVSLNGVPVPEDGELVVLPSGAETAAVEGSPEVQHQPSDLSVLSAKKNKKFSLANARVSFAVEAIDSGMSRRDSGASLASAGSVSSIKSSWSEAGMQLQVRDAFREEGSGLTDNQQKLLWARSKTRMMDELYEDNGVRLTRLAGPEEENNPSLLATIERRLVLMPGSKWGVSWDALGAMFNFYDFVTVPLTAFQPASGEPDAAQYASCIYFILHMLVEFFTGFTNKKVGQVAGRVEVRISHIAKHYLTSWFIFDVTLSSLDIALLTNSSKSWSQRTRTAVRIVLMGRILRLTRLQQGVSFLSNYISLHVRSDTLMILINLGVIFLSVIAFTHVVACSWYAIGTNEAHGMGWVAYYDMAGEDLWYRYITSYHWALAQLTGDASMTPRNVSERTFAVAALMTAFVVSISIVGNLTTLMTQMQLLTANYKRQVSVLQRYLMDNAVSTRLAQRILENAARAIERQRTTPPEDMVELLSAISEPLRVELHFEVFHDYLEMHPFFRHYAKKNPAGMRNICHLAVSRMNASEGDVIFSTGEVSEDQMMYFCVSGCLCYSIGGKENKFLEEEDWLNEAVLWTEWQQIGALKAVEDCVMICIHVKPFLKVVDKYKTKHFYPAAYARRFISELNMQERDCISEIFDDFIDIDTVAEEVFKPKKEEGARKTFRRMSSNLSKFLNQGKFGGDSKAKGDVPRTTVNPSS